MYVGHSSSGFWRMNLDTESWGSLASPPVRSRTGVPLLWPTMAVFGRSGLQAYRYDISSNSWSTVSGIWASGDEQSMTVTDRDGVLWAYQGAATGQL